MDLSARIAQRLEALDQQGLRRHLRRVDTACGPRVRVNQRDMLAFCSNDYLGLASHPAIIAALQEGAQRYGAGSGASHLISGHSHAHARLEERLAQLYSPYFDSPGTLYLCTGYMANLAVMTSLARLEEETVFFSERLNHASIIDGLRLARAKVSIYEHGDVAHLNQLLAETPAALRVVVTDSVFSMDGNLAPLQELADLCRQYDAILVVDDAHGFGVLGEQGLGVLEALSLKYDNLIYMGTLGKAAGVSGAFLVAQDQLIEWIVQQARSYIYTTAAAPALAHALQSSLDIITGEEGRQRRACINEHRATLKQYLHLHKWQAPASDTAIQPVIIGKNQLVSQVGSFLWNQGLWVAAIRPPTVPADTARLRITLSAAHSRNEVTRLARAVVQAEQEYAMQE
ncbi:MAG TPA: 8-amino-7-oxononanoate synthase [Pusillimonas sp.]|jgi:8-amino-7-oxononanoate synthase|nr:8-amino-7-oxononanoate synthase [Pusillimonas sp.]MBC42275.1 8-amino-7-oxononanoate synthase [Pusillimonas sp.]HBT34112.1 8-amino-7-oxononanoate synthase [Pusillimonas sp.]|tara:strand:- start:3940 stop:5139 length:1200 start_codon:yes stop_codon:yes gene_type:complete